MTPNNPEYDPVDVDALKQSIDLVEFARQYTQIEQISHSGEFAGPCPQCGGKDRFHVKQNRFYCRQCYPRGGDVIDLVRLLHGLSFMEACRWLASGTFSLPERPTPPPQGEPAREGWRSPAFQESARRTMQATQRLLLGDEGAAGREYLRRRGLDAQTWQAYGLGYGRRVHPIQRQNVPAIFIPWYSPDGTVIAAIQHRFIEPGLAKHARYSLKPSSAPILFGLHLLRPAETLVIVEGEFNCMSLHQSGLQALSVGSEANVSNLQARALLQAQVTPYTRVMIWFDNPAYSDQMVGWLTEAEPFREKSIYPIHAESDANDLLTDGRLQSFLDSIRP